MSDNQQLSTRIKQIIKYLNLTIWSFEKEIDVTKNSINKLVKSEGGIGVDKIAKIVAKYPTINSEWLLVGKGDMLLNNSNTELVSFKPNVKLYDIEAFAGIGTDIIRMEQVIEQWYIPGLLGEHFAVKISGTSMQGTLEHGDIIVVKKIEDYKDIITNRIYLVVCEGSPLVKRLIISKDTIELRSDNPFHRPQSTHVESEKISAIYKVISYLRNFENVEII